MDLSPWKKTPAGGGWPRPSVGPSAAGIGGKIEARVERLAARVEELEAALSLLHAVAVQQWPDGRLHLPVDTQLRIDIGNTHLSMDVRSFSLQVNGERVIDARPDSMSPPPPESVPSLQQIASQSSPGSWQTQAQQSGTESPRSSPPGRRLDYPR